MLAATMATGAGKSALTSVAARAPAVSAVLRPDEWRARARAHRDRVLSAIGTDDSLAYDRDDPIRNFVFEYYSFKPKQLLHWSPGLGVGLQGVARADLGKMIPTAKHWALDEETGALVLAPDGGALTQRKLGALRHGLEVLRASVGREPHFLCHGLHEWAMLYHPSAATEAGVPPPQRHQRAVPLRVSQDELNACVESTPIRCTHYDAFRFFTEPARPLNRLGELTRPGQPAAEQPACVHAAMDLFKWVLKAMPYVDASLVPLTLRLALKARVLDMRASPYDVSRWACASPPATAGAEGDDDDAPAPVPHGAHQLSPLTLADLSPIRVETSRGRAAYRAYQRALFAESQPIRESVLAEYERLFGLGDLTMIDH